MLFMWYYIFVSVMVTYGMESAITVKGQATIPKPIREHLGLSPGDRLKFFLHPDGTVVLLPKVPALALRGMLRSRRRRSVSIARMNKAIGEGVAVGNRRAKRR
jgi:antitoxin PrlF